MNKHPNYTALYEEAFSKVPSEFTSIQFLNICRRLGLSELAIRNQVYYGFLKRRCKKMSKFIYIKSSEGNNNSFLFSQDATKITSNSVADAITLLKSLGYKIQKQTTIFEEI